ncbi:thiamine pyrophosphate-binding protein [Termitidicoccus mucosus]|uniref:Acetolactate synthase n=1 Tax=Termitidicoccus mucosus TaxID=1184151 RepID=A0A178IK75_9BACT|nr:acetolactate synthase [Opitutaceae bacterium TSB47]
MIRVADYIAQTLARHGIRHVFMVTGGGAMHLNDAFGRNRDLQIVCCHHEQACAIAAETYYRTTNRMAAVNVTTGPGGTNAITGVYGAYVDSMAMVVVSGQVKWETLVRSTALPLRQLGDQEVDIIRMIEGITKYAVVVQNPQSIRYHLERALHLASHGRPGPVWLDVPINVQGAMIDPASLTGYDPADDAIAWETSDLRATVVDIVTRLRAAERPVIYAGTGVRLSGQYDTFLRLAERLGVPMVGAWNSNDLLPNNHLAYAGRPGSIGDRPGNFTVQNSDLLIILGCRLNIRLVSYNWEKFARRAYKVMVDIDAAELKKPTLKIDLPVHADLKDFLPAFEEATRGWNPRHADWLAWCRERVAKYSVVLPEYWDLKDKVNPYCFMDRLSAQLCDGELIVCGDGTACVTAFQTIKIRPRQRLFHNSGCAPMGYDLPGAIGVAIANPGRRVVCLAGDGSVMMNLQELQTIAGRGLPVKIFILNNTGYHSIRQTQANFFADNIVGCGTDSGLSFPDFDKVAHAFGLPFKRCQTHAELDACIEATLIEPGPTLCEIMLDLKQSFAPKLSSRKLDDGRMVTAALEDMAPFLPREELKANMLVPIFES